LVRDERENGTDGEENNQLVQEDSYGTDQQTKHKDIETVLSDYMIKEQSL